LGFTPQYLNVLGGYKIQGKSAENTKLILEQAKKLEKAGVFCIVLEMIPEEAAKYITEKLLIPTIGIGAGRYTDGQVLVADDILGKFSEFKPKFARHYADLKTVIKEAAQMYVSDVRSGNFPNETEVFHLTKEETEKLESFCYQ
jgi:3-methyl-2-oxobutanoate hydroxymethyltransferase